MIDRNEMRMTQGAYPMRFGTEAVRVVGIVSQMCCEHFDGDLTLQHKILGPIDLGHPPYA
jgi:hypothetical protein